MVKRAERLGLKAKEFILFNEGRAAIDDHIKSHHHDFIVMGSHGTGGFKEILGSNTQKVVRYANAPVLVVKHNSEEQKIDTIVFASNFDNEAIEPFQTVVDFALLVDAKIHVLYVNVPNNFQETDDVESKIAEFLKSFEGVSCTVNLYDALNPERGILKFSEKINADLIAVATHGRSGFMRMISTSITESLVNHSNLPILSVNVNTK